jgi:hypothetical protein
MTSDERLASIEAAHRPVEQEGVMGCRHPTNGGWYWWAECDIAYLLARLREVEQEHAAANDVPFLKARLREVEQERDDAQAKAVQHWLRLMQAIKERDAARVDADRLAEALRLLQSAGLTSPGDDRALAAHEAARA